MPRLQTYPPDRIKMLQQVFGWVDDEYDRLPIEREILGDPPMPAAEDAALRGAEVQ